MRLSWWRHQLASMCPPGALQLSPQWVQLAPLSVLLQLGLQRARRLASLLTSLQQIQQLSPLALHGRTPNRTTEVSEQLVLAAAAHAKHAPQPLPLPPHDEEAAAALWAKGVAKQLAPPKRRNPN